MRILMLTQFYPPDIGGEERHVRNLSLALAERGHDVDVLTTALPETGSGVSLEDGLSIHRVRTTAQRLPLHGDPNRPHATPFPDIEMSRTINERLADGRYDVVHAHNWIVNSALSPTARHHVPLVQTLHDYSHVCAVKRYVNNGAECSGPSLLKCTACGAGHYGKLIGPATVATNTIMAHQRRRHVTHFIAVSSAVAIYNGLEHGTVPFEVIPNFIPDDLITQHPPQPDGPMVFVGDLTSQKGVLVLAEAFGRLVNPPELLMAGRQIPGVEVEALPGLRQIGPLPHDKVMPIIGSARLVVVPSIMPDPCPTVVLEAMAKGRPVVASANGGIVDMIEDGVSGQLVEAGDPVALAVALSKVLDNPDRAAAMGIAAYSRVKNFTASAVVERVETVYARSITAEMIFPASQQMATHR